MVRACNPIRPNASPAPLIRLSSEDNSGILSSSSAHLFEGGRDVRGSESDSVLKYQAFFLRSFQRNLDAVLYYTVYNQFGFLRTKELNTNTLQWKIINAV